MTQCNMQNLKSNHLSRLGSFRLLMSIIILTSSVMCLAMAFVAIILSGVNVQLLYFLIASLSLGMIGSILFGNTLKFR